MSGLLNSSGTLASAGALVFSSTGLTSKVASIGCSCSDASSWKSLQGSSFFVGTSALPGTTAGFCSTFLLKFLILGRISTCHFLKGSAFSLVSLPSSSSLTSLSNFPSTSRI
jgi:hypothetical protein